MFKERKSTSVQSLSPSLRFVSLASCTAVRSLPDFARQSLVLSTTMAFFALATLLIFASGLAASKQPNILFILTDDQDAHMQSVQHMPLLQQYIVDKGTTFARHFCSVAQCCPARSTIWTGRASHNTNVGFVCSGRSDLAADGSPGD